METHLPMLSQSGPAAPARQGARREDRLAALFRGAGVPVRFRPGATVALHGSPVARVFRIESGTARCCTITEEGRRQIFRFVRPGEVIGLVESERWHFTAEAVDAVLARALPRDLLDRETARDEELRREVRGHIAADQERLERQLVSLSWLQAPERVLCFLRDFAASTPPRDGFLVLPMTRQDIGDHLGLSLETVSRAFGTLRRQGRIVTRGSERFRIVEDAEQSAAA